MPSDSTGEGRRKVLGGRYQLGNRLGAGATSTVFEAVDVQLERTVAVKVLHPSILIEPVMLRRFRAAAQTLAGLSHPNVVAVYDWGEEEVRGEQTAYLVMEHLAGGSLRAMIDRGRRLTPSQALVVGLDVCRGLDHIHRRGLVHGDLKPSNLLFGADRRLRIADVGLSRLIADTYGDDVRQLDNQTAKYVSPEQALGRPPEPKSDVYALALDLVEAVTGQLPFAGDTTVATLSNRIDKLMPVSADLGPLASVLEKAGRSIAADRSSAAEFGRALVQIAEKLPRPAPLPLVDGVPSMFDAPAGQETTSELTRFRDPTGQMTGPAGATGGMRRPVDPTGAGDRTGSLGRDPSGGIQRPAGSRDPSGSIPRDITGGTPRPRVIAVDSSGAIHRPDEVTAHRPFLTYLLIALGVIAAAVLGVVAFRKLSTPTHEVPVLAGIEQGVALNQIAGFGWEVDPQTERNDTVAQGLVIRTDPEAGAMVKKGAPFVLVVSAGPTLTVLPDITGDTPESAIAKLTTAGLQFSAGEQMYSEEIAAGVIISWRVAAQPALIAGAEVTRGTSVEGVISLGPKPRDIPDLINVKFEDAAALMAAQQITLERNPVDEFSDSAPIGTIMIQDVPGGQAIPRGSIIKVTVSKGQDLVAVPNIGGLDYNTTKAALEAAGLGIGTATGDGFGGVVIGVSLEGRQIVFGDLVKRGTLLDLEFPPVAAPAVTP
jgi:eukaryotic-like serine/threonine-protein kinase